MIGKYSGVVARTKSENSETVAIHCFLHRLALAVKPMPTDLIEVLEDVTKIVNFIKARPLNSRIFEVLCEDTGRKLTKRHCYILKFVGCREGRCWQDLMSYMKRFTAFYLIKSTSLLLN